MNYFHETIIRDIVDIFGDLKDISSMAIFKNRNKSIKSIAQASAALTCVFPTFVSDSLGIEASGLASKALERKQTQMLELLFGAYQTYTLNGDENFDPVKYINKFHKNINIDSDVTVDGVLDTINKVVSMTENYGMITSQFGTDVITEAEINKQMKEDLKNINYVLPDTLSENVMHRINTNYGFKVLNEKDMDPDMAREEARKNAAEQRAWADEARKNAREQRAWADEDRKNADEARKNAREQRADADEIRKNAAEQRSRNSEARQADRHGLDMSKGRIDNFKNTQQIKQAMLPQLRDVDVKKANELVGTPMVLTVHLVKDGSVIEPVSFMIAVKSKMYPLKSSDVTNRIIYKNKDRNFFSKLVKVSTREISFVSDFLFALDQAKIDALSHSKRGSSSKMWKVLERSALKAKFSRSLGKQNEYMAISSLIVSQEEVEYMKRFENLDVENPAVIRPIMDAYNLLSFVIVDETNEVAKFIFNTGNDLYENISFTMLEKEASNGQYRKMINLMSKVK